MVVKSGWSVPVGRPLQSSLVKAMRVRVKAMVEPQNGMGRRLLMVLAVLAVAPALGYHFECRAQDAMPVPQNRASAGAPGANILNLSGADYRISPGDVIAVKVEKADELSQNFQVTTQGTILMNYIGVVEAARKTPQELQSVIADRLRGRYLKNPYVTVTVTQYYTRSFFIQGAVKSGGVFQVGGKPSLLTLITLAGGLEKGHGSTAYIVRKTKVEGIQLPESKPTLGSPTQSPDGAASEPIPQPLKSSS